MKFLSTLVVLATLSVFTEALNLDHVQRGTYNRIARRGNDDGTDGHGPVRIRWRSRNF